MDTDIEFIQYVNFLVKSYNDIKKHSASAQIRLQVMNKGADYKHDFVIKNMESQKGKIIRQLKKYLDHWPLWSEWMEHIPGIGAYSAAELIILYYYRFMPVHPDCGTKLIKKENTYWCETCEQSVKGEGILTYILEEKDFPTISKFWKYMGMHVENGEKVKRKKGVVSDWSAKGRTLMHLIGTSFVRKKSEYRDFYLLRREKREKTHPDASNGHKDNMCRHETAKLFLSHLWTVARTLDGKPVSEPYAGTIMGHTNIIKPFYFEG